MFHLHFQSSLGYLEMSRYHSYFILILKCSLDVSSAYSIVITLSPKQCPCRACKKAYENISPALYLLIHSSKTASVKVCRRTKIGSFGDKWVCPPVPFRNR